MPSDVVDQVRAAMASYAGGDDSPPMQVCRGLMSLSEQLGEQMRRLEARPSADVERAVRQALTGLGPELRKRWAWQRWAWVSSAAALVVACACLVVGVLCYNLGAAESEKWSEWCSQSANQQIMGKTRFCLIPVAK